MNNELTPYVARGVIFLTPEMEVPLHDKRFVEATEAPGLLDYWQLVRKHKWKIVACFLFAIIGAGVYVFSQTPLYTANATLVIERKGPQVVNIQQVLADGIDSDEQNYYQSQFEMLKSRSLAAEVIKAEGLETNHAFTGHGREKSFLENMRATFTAWLSLPYGEPWRTAAPKAPNPYGVNPALIDAYQGMLEIEPLKKSRLAKVAFTSPDPTLSAAIANAHAKAYIRQGQKLRSQANEGARTFLETKLAELKERVEKSESALNQFRRGKGIISLEDKENIVVDRLSDLNKRLTEAEAERIGLITTRYPRCLITRSSRALGANSSILKANMPTSPPNTSQAIRPWRS
jgi:succinoglycan biosynthesis transport protein ExoP